MPEEQLLAHVPWSHSAEAHSRPPSHRWPSFLRHTPLTAVLLVGHTHVLLPAFQVEPVGTLQVHCVEPKPGVPAPAAQRVQGGAPSAEKNCGLHTQLLVALLGDAFGNTLHELVQTPPLASLQVPLAHSAPLTQGRPSVSRHMLEVATIWPAGHTQALVLGSQTCPAMAWHSHWLSPAEVVVAPAGHWVHPLMPDDEKKPVLQMQPPAPSSSLPAGHTLTHSGLPCSVVAAQIPESHNAAPPRHGWPMSSKQTPPADGTVPVGHSQDAVASTQAEPMGAKQMHAVAPRLEFEPVGHAMQSGAPVAEKKPASHRQVSPRELLPSGHVSTQTPLVGAEHRPLRHSLPCVHGWLLFLRHLPSTNVCPGWHTHALVAALHTAVLFAAHVQAVEPAVDATEPAPHMVHGVRPLGPK